MSCIYRLYDSSGNVQEYTYEELVEEFSKKIENGEFSDLSDILYSRDSVQATLATKLRSKSKELSAKKNISFVNGEPDYTKDDSYTPLGFINSGHYRFIQGEKIVLEQNDADFRAEIVESYKDTMSEEDAIRMANNTIQSWDLISEDAKELHRLLNTFDFRHGDEIDFKHHLKNSKFESLAVLLWQLVDQLRKIMYGNHKISDDTSMIILNVNLSAILNKVGKEIIGHYDNIVIDAEGNLHVYNYKITTGDHNRWGSVKRNAYGHQLALLKRILEYNGISVKNTKMHLIPIRLYYSDDFKTINDITTHGCKELTFTNLQNIASKYFIKSNVELKEFNSDTVNRINKNLSIFFPDRNITFKGILKSVDEWINYNYSATKWENRIKYVGEPNCAYKLYFDDSFEKFVSIKDPTAPIKNKELRDAVAKHLQSDSSETKFLDDLMLDIKRSIQKGKSRFSAGSSTNLKKVAKYLSEELAQYFVFTEEGQLKIRNNDWSLIANDTLLNAHILAFVNNKTLQIDVIVLSQYNLRSKLLFRGNNNIMGSYVRDGARDTQNLINYDANFGNIEATRALIILNECLNDIKEHGKLGSLKVISTLQGGHMKNYSLERLSKDMFLHQVRVLKQNVKGFAYKNNFSTVRYVDPLTLLMVDYSAILEADNLNKGDKSELKTIGIEELDELSSREHKRIALKSLLEKIKTIDETIPSLPTSKILSIVKSRTENSKYKALVTLYKDILEAYCYYSDISVDNETKISQWDEYGFTLDKVPNRTYRVIVNSFTKTIDDIAYKVREAYNPIYNFTELFYTDIGFSKLRTSLSGDQVNAFKNLYKVNSEGDIIMQFRNPYELDTQTPLSSAEKTYLKKVLYHLTKIRSKMYGFEFNFNSSQIDNPEYIKFLNKNKWLFNVPLEKASKASIRALGIKVWLSDKKRLANAILKDPKSYISEVIQGIESKQERNELTETFESLDLRNKYVAGDGHPNYESRRNELLNELPITYWETNVENILAHYLEKQIHVEELNSTLIGIKGALLKLEMLREETGTNLEDGIEQTIKLIKDFTKYNVFNISIMSPNSQTVSAWINPFREFVSTAYIAGNINAAFRDTFEGLWHNVARTITKYKTNISAKDLTKAYKEVVKASFTSIRDITIIDELCKTYRLSNLDVARISEGLTTSRGGILNIDNWLYSTLRQPDYLNRMVLFVATCMKDGSWQAFSLDENNKLVYNWKDDARYSIFAKGLTENPEYEKLKIAYYNAVRLYNKENPANVIEYGADLPQVYNFKEILQIRELAESIYGNYNKSMRAKYEATFLGLNFAMFSTWMNGMIANYFAKPGLYENELFIILQERNSSGNLLWINEFGEEIEEIDDGETKKYINVLTGEEVSKKGLMPAFEKIPRVVQGIIWTVKEAFQALSKFDENGNYIGGREFLEEIWSDEMLRANLKKLLSDLIAVMLFGAMFKYVLTPAYQEFKKTDMKENPFLVNAITETLYKGSSRSYDGFLGPIAPIEFIGESTNPPMYKLLTKLFKDTSKVIFSDKTLLSFFSGNFAPFKSFQDSYNILLSQIYL